MLYGRYLCPMQNTSRVLYLSYDGLTDPLGQSQILPYIEGLSEQGYRFAIISFEKKDRFATGKGRINLRCSEKNIQWIPLTYTKNPPVFSTIYDTDKLYRNVKDLVETQDFDLIHCRSYIPALVALRVKKELKIPFLFDMRGFWADERVDGKIWNLKNPIYRKVYDYFKKNERRFLEEAAAIVSLTHAGKEEIERWFHEDERFGGSSDHYNYDRASNVTEKISVIPCAADLDLFDLSKVPANKRKWLCAVHGLDPDHEYLGYVGSLGTWYMAAEMLRLYDVIRAKRPALRFLVLTHDNIDALRTQADKLDIPGSYIISIAAERREVPALMSLMAASVFFILPAYSKKASSPTKQGELMGMGIPVICNDRVGDTADIINRYAAGHVVSDFTPADFDKVATAWEKLIDSDRTKIRQGAEEYFSLKKGIAAYAKIYKDIIPTAPVSVVSKLQSKTA